MKPSSFVVPWWPALVGLVMALLAACAPAAAQPEADPPGRVGRIADLSGPVGRFDLEQGQWEAAERNRPLTTGDRISTGRDASAEIRIGSTTLTLAEATEVEFLRLDDDQMRIELHRGSLALRLRSREVAAETVVGTEEAWLRPLRGGLYRLDRDDDTTQATSWRGEWQVEPDPALVVDTGRRLQLWREPRSGALRHRWADPVDDAFAQRVLLADRDEPRSASASHVSPEMTGWEELDRHGRWDRHPDYGPVWIPFGVAVDWVPYRDGRWAWVRPWGWTWIDAAPWGFAPSHYGRWIEWRTRWVWVPGPYVLRPVFAPALVVWIDGPPPPLGVHVGRPSVRWAPLPPWEPYRPWYRASPRHPDRIDPPADWRRRPPPERRDGIGYGPGGVPRGVTVVPPDVLRRPPHLEPPRPLPLPPPRITRPRDGERDGDRPRDRDNRPDREPDRPGDRSPRPVLPVAPPVPGLTPPVTVHPPVMGTPPPRPPAPTAPAEPRAPTMRALPVRPTPPAEPTAQPAPPPRTAPAAPAAPPAAAPRPERADKPEPPADRQRDDGRSRPEGRQSVR